MLFPQFEIIDFGAFDSRMKFPKGTLTAERLVERYELELYTAVSSSVTYIDGATIPLHCGALLCGKPGQKRYSRLPFRCFYFHLRAYDEALTALLDRIPNVAIPGNLPELSKLFQELSILEPETHSEQRLLFQSLVCRILHLATEATAVGCGKNTSALYFHHETLLMIGKFIWENCAERLDLQTLAARANLSPVYFHRIFTEFFGITPNQYVRNCRLSTAKAKLLTSDYSIADIAEDCGFSSQSYFQDQFKRTVGKTPLQYRKSMLSRLNI